MIVQNLTTRTLSEMYFILHSRIKKKIKKEKTNWNQEFKPTWGHILPFLSFSFAVMENRGYQQTSITVKVTWQREDTASDTANVTDVH